MLFSFYGKNVSFLKTILLVFLDLVVLFLYNESDILKKAGVIYGFKIRFRQNQGLFN